MDVSSHIQVIVNSKILPFYLQECFSYYMTLEFLDDLTLESLLSLLVTILTMHLCC
jgi:hypothetical protein